MFQYCIAQRHGKHPPPLHPPAAPDEQTAHRARLQCEGPGPGCESGCGMDAHSERLAAMSSEFETFSFRLNRIRTKSEGSIPDWKKQQVVLN